MMKFITKTMPLFVNGQATWQPGECPICKSAVESIAPYGDAVNGCQQVVTHPCDHILTLPEVLEMTLL